MSSALVRTGLAVVAAMVAASTLLLAQRGAAPDPLVRQNAVTQVGPHTYVILDDFVPLVPNVGIVVGETGTLVIDPGLGRRNGETVLAEAKRLSRGDRLFIVSTHFHPEHTTGYLAFPDDAVYINSTTQEAEWADSGMGMVQAFSKRSPLTMELLADATRRVADITFERDYTLDLGGVTVRALLVGPTHTLGDTGFFVEQDRVLFAGDVVMTDSFVAAGGAASMRAWLAAFDAFEAWQPETVVPAHGAVGQADVIAANRTVMTEIRDRTLELKKQGMSIDEAVKIVSAEQTARHPGWPRANGVANAARAAWNESE
jgi:glyoxylase-like metal-dependent hydrolase (beta-lactamase superfamily II)